MPEQEKKLHQKRQDFRARTPEGIKQADRRIARAMGVFEDALPVVLRVAEISTDGEFNTVLIQPPMGGFVIKSPDELADYNTHKILSREVQVLDILEDGMVRNGIKLPVQVPRIIADSTDGTSTHIWAAFTAVPGRNLKRSEIWDWFKPDEYRDLGHRLGALTVGVSQAVKIPSFRRLIGEYDPYVIDRELQLQAVLSELGMFEELGYRNLTRLLRQLGDDYIALQSEREAATPIVTHDDLHEGNLAFEQSQAGQWELVEVFDWANAKVGSAARNFRQLSLLSPEALHAAMETWQEETGEVISERLVRFWASLQYAIGCTKVIKEFGKVTDFTTQSMQRLHPEVDWQTEFSRAIPLKVEPTAEDV